jgi:hypothetical protein
VFIVTEIEQSPQEHPTPSLREIRVLRALRLQEAKGKRFSIVPALTTVFSLS